MTFLANFDLNRIQYMFFVFLLLMLEAGVTADVFLNRAWEEVCYYDQKLNLIITLWFCGYKLP
jgi:hypothetical protein